MMYVQDHDERYPFNATTITRSQWPSVITPYTAASTANKEAYARTQLYRCPSSWLTLQGGNILDFDKGNYAANRAVLTDGAHTPVSEIQALSLAVMPSPAGTYMIFDGSLSAMSASRAYGPKLDKEEYIPGTGPGSPNNFTGSGSFDAKYKSLQGDFETGRHFGGINMLFADGRVKWVKSQEVVAEARSCPNGCYPWTTDRTTAASAWNPWLDHN